jgi:hypothetical protein
MNSLFKPLVAAVGIGALVVASFASDAHAFQMHSRSAPLTRSWGSLGSYSTQSRPGVVIGHLPQHAARVYAPQLPYRAPSHIYRYDPVRIHANQQIFRQQQAQQYNLARAQALDNLAPTQAFQQNDKRFHDPNGDITPYYSPGLCPYPYGGYYRC